jgi:hypothetical protein
MDKHFSAPWHFFEHSIYLFAGELRASSGNLGSVRQLGNLLISNKHWSFSVCSRRFRASPQH